MQKTHWILAILLILGVQTVSAQDKNITIIHTNDLHSHFLGFSPNIDYSPETIGDDTTIGGWARIATLIRETKKSRNNPVLVLDAGDFLMGSLFHLQSREEAFELRLMKAMGYDMLTLGNHEFDLMPKGLARILETARSRESMPPMVASNVVFSPDSPKDDTLERLFEEGVVKPYRILDRSGLTIGFFGLMGNNAAEVAPFAAPVTFKDPIETATKMVQILREREKVDLVVCLSHSGLHEESDLSEDEVLAKEVPGIDVIISGHTHTKNNGAIRVNDTIIVQAWEYGKQVGILDLVHTDKNVSVKEYKLVNIDDSIAGDAEISAMIQEFETVTERNLSSSGAYGFRDVIAHTDFPLEIKTDESNIGNLITDAITWYANRYDYDPADPVSRIAVSVISNGVIRDNIVPGITGNISVCDAFRAIPLGIGMDDTMGYPLIAIYIYPSEIKKTLEILTSIYPLKGDDYYIQISGLKFTYNPNRMIFDRVTDISMGNEEIGFQPLDYSASNRQLIRIAADIYNATFLKVIGSFTMQILTIIPKDRHGNPVDDLKTMRIDMDKTEDGIQELKEWQGVMEYIRSFPDRNGDGIADIPEKYRGKLGRNLARPSLNPFNLVKRGTWVTWTVFGLLILCVLVLFFISRFVIKKLRHTTK
jgi:5'-nucleotidase / UDP-sugar diphosphatase